jgi:very-short-patch-repair endonuclease
MEHLHMTTCISWETPTRHTRLKNGKPCSEWRFLATCACGEKRWLKKCDARKVEQGGASCRICQRRAAGAKGYATTKAKYGAAFGAKIVQDYRLSHPSSLELQIMAHLESLNVSYQREVIVCDRWLVDFIIDGQLVIEVDGQYVHSKRDPNLEAQRRDQIRECGYSLLHLREADVPQSRSLIALFVMENRHVTATEPHHA